MTHFLIDNDLTNEQSMKLMKELLLFTERVDWEHTRWSTHAWTINLCSLLPYCKLNVIVWNFLTSLHLFAKRLSPVCTVSRWVQNRMQTGWGTRFSQSGVRVSYKKTSGGTGEHAWRGYHRRGCVLTNEQRDRRLFVFTTLSTCNRTGMTETNILMIDRLLGVFLNFS